MPEPSSPDPRHELLAATDSSATPQTPTYDLSLDARDVAEASGADAAEIHDRTVASRIRIWSRFSPVEWQAMRGIRVAAYLMFTGELLFVFAGILMYLMAQDGSPPPNRKAPALPLAVILVAFLGWAELVHGKFYAIFKQVGRINASPIAFALFADFGVLMCALLIGVESIRIWSLIGYSVCMLLSRVATTIYFGRVGEALRASYVKKGARLVVLCYFFIVLSAALVGVGIYLGPKNVYAPAFFGSGMYFMMIIGAIAQLGYMGLTLATALQINPPPEDAVYPQVYDNE